MSNGCGTPGCTDPNCEYGKGPNIDPITKPVDNRMVKCVLDGYVDCPAKTPEACICYRMQLTASHEYRNMYEERYQHKYGRDEQ